ncbi:ubiquitin-protein ligase molybdopterin-converting factor [Flagelloscypha sp. PMI_526]|nr:ubiquitin-protein ligase molybdopterin-converting factor [Flagelloscypha sp. PMI_526]
MYGNISFQSHKVQLIATAAAATVVTATAFSAYATLTQRARRKRLNDHIARSIESSRNDLRTPPTPLDEPSRSQSFKDASSVLSVYDPEEDEEFMKEQLARNYAFFGDQSMEKLRGSSVVIVGCGGVGSWTAVMLARSGVSKIKLIDFDQVTLSSLNRHATATRSDVGTPKVDCIAQALKRIVQHIEVECIREIWRLEDGSGKHLHGVDWVVDAIDNISTKVDLLKYCHQNEIKVFSSMGAGAKCDPTRIQIADISNTTYDPLARSVRRGLKLSGILSGIPVVYSTEVPDVKLLPLPEEEFQKGPVKELGAFDDFRVRILPVLGPLPAIFGLNIATYILCDLAGKPILNPMPVKNRRKVYEKVYRDLLIRERKLTGQGEALTRLPFDEDDVGLLVDDLYRGRSCVPPYDVPTKPALVRWDLNERLTLDNCAMMDSKDADKHITELQGTPTLPSVLWGKEAQAVVDRVKKELINQRDWMNF